MELDFLSPLGALVVLAGVVPLVLVAVVERRNERARTLLALPGPARAARLALPVAIALLALVLGVAAAQPVVRTEQSRTVRLDAEAMLAVDISRSMAASSSASSPTRIERARAIAGRLHAAMPDVPMGLGTFTDRPLPMLFPTSDPHAFVAAVEKSLGIEEPPGIGTSITISSYDAVAPFATEGYFGPKARKRLLVIVTDAESEGFNEAGIRTSFRAKPRTGVVLIRMGRAGERVYGTDGLPESDYIPPAASGRTLKQFLAATRAKEFGEGDVEGAVQAARAALGDGPRAELGTTPDQHALAPWLVLAGVLPLGVVLRKRNF